MTLPATTMAQLKAGDDNQSNPPANSLAEAFAGRHIHFVGIGGSGMCGLAHMLSQAGAMVTGTDLVESQTLEKLRRLGALVQLENGGSDLLADTQMVVYSAAVRDEHPALAEARRRGLTILKYAQLLGQVMNLKNGIAIAGTHGKSTTTAMTAYVLTAAGLDPSFVVGAPSPQLAGSSHGGKGSHFVVEACEYDRSFDNLFPHIAAVLNIEEDHLDYYRDIHEITAAFGKFVSQVNPGGLLIIPVADSSCRRAAAQTAASVETYGLEVQADWTATDIVQQDGHIRFAVAYRRQPVGHLVLNIPGRHNVGNALVAAAIATRCGVTWDSIARAVREFAGVNRRSQWLGCFRQVTVVDDYAHHPTEIRATLLALREHYQPQRLICVFQPHQHSRTRLLLADFARSFNQADLIIVPDIFFVRDTEADRAAVTAQTLVARLRENGREALHIASFEDIVTYLAGSIRPGDLVVSMGAGPVWEVTDGLVRGF
jgi:UDP-N-acetylmuramate--alanine ligase